MRMKTFTAVLRKLARTIARQHGIKVVFKGKTAKTDSKVIILPAIPPGTVLTPLQQEEFFGLLDHEISHVKFTNFAVTSQQMDPLHFHIMNVLEDPRVENCFIKEYPGSKRGLDLVCEKYEREFQEELVKRGGEKVGTLTLEYVFEMIYEQAYVARGRQPLLQGRLTDYPELKEVFLLVNKGTSASNTAAVKDAADKIYEILKKLFPQEMEKRLDNRMHPDLEALLKFLEALFGQGGSKAGKILGQIVAESAEEDAKLMAALQQMRQAGNCSRRVVENGNQVLAPCSTAGDRIFYYGFEDLDQYERYQEDLSESIRMMRKALHVFLKSRGRKNYDRGLETGRLDTNSLWKIRTGETKRLFMEKRVTQMVNTATTMMIDLSGSMDEELVAHTSILMNEALAGVPKLESMIAGFTTNDFTDHSGAPGGRSVGLDIPVFKKFGENGRAVKARIGGIKTSNYTPLGEAMHYGMESLLDRKEARKVLWLVTDGMPTFPKRDNNHNDFLLMKKVKTRCEAAGIKVVILCVKVDVDAMAPFADATVSIPSINKLPESVLELVKDLVSMEAA